MAKSVNASVLETSVIWLILLAFNFLALWVLRGADDGEWSPGFAAGCTAAIGALALVFKLAAVAWKRWRSRRADSGV